MSDTRRFPRPFRILAYVVFTSGLCGLVWSWHELPPQASVSVVLLAVGAVLSLNYAMYLDRYNISLTYPLTVAAIVLAGPTAAAIVAALSAITWEDIRSKTPLTAMMFNIGELVVVTLAAGWVYRALGMLLNESVVPELPFSASDFPWILVPLLAVALICTFGNVALMALALSTVRSQRLQQSISELAWLIPSQFSLAFVGYLIAQVLAINAIALPLFVAPLLVARQLYQRYAGLKEAYADTVRSLIGALEAKDPYTRGHSERVAGYALELGAEVGLDAGTLERLEYAALLHDLGKLAVPGTLLTKPGSLTDGEMDLIRLHPTRGAAMVAKIPPLKDLSELVGNHHEWYGGGGYPLDAKGSEIPRLSLILCVADSYDAMTTTRSYRPALTRDQAVAQLIGGAGGQFDPELVRAFIEGRVGCQSQEAEEPSEIPRAAVAAPVQGGQAL
jgi:HD-GYP domain-containing protein (c-di-GMP phosphodiesterase class II)